LNVAVDLAYHILRKLDRANGSLVSTHLAHAPVQPIDAQLITFHICVLPTANGKPTPAAVRKLTNRAVSTTPIKILVVERDPDVVSAKFVEIANLVHIPRRGAFVAISHVQPELTYDVPITAQGGRMVWTLIPETYCAVADAAGLPFPALAKLYEPNLLWVDGSDHRNDSYFLRLDAFVARYQ